MEVLGLCMRCCAVQAAEWLPVCKLCGTHLQVRCNSTKYGEQHSQLESYGQSMGSLAEERCRCHQDLSCSCHQPWQLFSEASQASFGDERGRYTSND